MRLIIHTDELERLLANNGDLDSPYVGPYVTGKYCADKDEVLVWRASRFKLVGYAPTSGAASGN